MKNKSYYLDLADRWFDALLTGDDEQELKSFLATTDDPDFDEVKAVAGFFAAGKAVVEKASEAYRTEVSVDASRRAIRLWRAAALAFAASLALVAGMGLYHRQNDCYILAYGEKSTDPQLALADMSATLEGLFADGENIAEELFDLFNPAL